MHCGWNSCLHGSSFGDVVMLSKQIEHTFGVGGLGRFFLRAGTGLL